MQFTRYPKPIVIGLANPVENLPISHIFPTILTNINCPLYPAVLHAIPKCWNLPRKLGRRQSRVHPRTILSHVSSRCHMFEVR